MYYIKCSKCSELITVKSEFMVLCPHCNKKLDNSYREWSARHDGATYEHYLSQVCVSETAISGLDEQRRLTRRIGISRNFKRFGIALLISLVSVVAVVWGYYIYKDSQKGASINAIMEDNWKINYYEDMGVTFKFPFLLTEVPQAVDSATVVSDDTTQVIHRFLSRTWSRADVAAINVSRIEYVPAFGVNREAATQQILQSMVSSNDMKALEFVPSDYSMGQGIKARMFSGSYLIKAEAYQFRAVMVLQGDTVWYFMVAYPRSMPEGTLLAEKFFKSIIL